MTERPYIGLRRFRLPAALAVGLFLLAIAYLSTTVAREVDAFDRAKSETAQWSLAQTEVELLTLIAALRQDPLDLDHVRLSYDILYSRIETLSQARVFGALRDTEVFSKHLNDLRDFIDETVPYFDSTDPVLLSQLSEIEMDATEARRVARRLALEGLATFSQISEERRDAIAMRTGQLAVAIILLFSGILLALAFLIRLNKRATDRGLALQASSARINAIVETALDGVIVADETYRVVDFSPAAETIFGLHAAQAIGLDFLQFIEDVSEDGGLASASAVLDDFLEQNDHTTKAVRRADGTTFPAEIALTKAEVPGGAIYIAVVRDISRRVADEKEIVAARDVALASERLKSDFLATMSHEIRTPLNGLLGNMDLLRDTPMTPTQTRFIGNMESSGRILMRHVNDVLDITQYDTGKMKIIPRPTHLPTLLEDIIATQDSLARAQQTSLSWGWSGAAVPWVNVDPDRLEHILMNIVGNAVKFTIDGTVHLAIACSEGADDWNLQIKIADTGPGIEPSMLPRIFDDFVTGDTAYDRQSSGTGLGLSIAKRFAEGLDGSLTVSSTPGQGTVFTIDIPVTPASPPRDYHSMPHLAPLPSLSVLVVEDNAINRTVVREMLEGDGHRVTEANDGCDGVACANKARFDVILMDISMPVLDGCAAAIEIKRAGGKSAATPIVALTANALEADQKKFRLAGMIATLTKPLTRADLRAVLRACVAEPVVADAVILDAGHVAETRAVLSDAAFQKVSDRFEVEMDDFLGWFTLAPPVCPSELAERAHKVAGSASVFGACRLAEVLKALETAARSDDPIMTMKLHARLSIVWTDTKAAQEALAHTSGPPQAAE